MNLCDEQWIRRKTRPDYRREMQSEVRIVDLFCGCGGLSLGAFEAIRLRSSTPRVVLAVDLDPHAMAVYRHNFGVDGTIALQESITDIFAACLGDKLRSREEELRRRCARVEIIVAGPPCQGHSDLNNSSRRDDPRNSLYLRVVRAAKVFSPQAVVIENVPTVVHDKGQVVAAATSALTALGYMVTSRVMAAHELGLAQTRRRHVLIASKNGEVKLSFLSASPKKTIRDYIADLENLNGARKPLFDFASTMSAENLGRAEYLYTNDLYDLPNRLRPQCHRGEHSYVSMYGRLNWDKPAQTITSGFGSMGQGRYLHPSQCRTLTPHEAARLQGFPDFFDFSKITSRVALQTTIGNAVPPRLGAVLVDQLFEQGCLQPVRTEHSR